MNKESCSKKITKNVKKQLSKNLQKKQIVVKKVRGNKKKSMKKEIKYKFVEKISKKNLMTKSNIKKLFFCIYML